MAYADVDTAFRAARASGDVYGRCEAAMVRRALVRQPSVVNADDQREIRVIAQIINGSYPPAWVRTFMSLLDTAGQLANPTDGQLDTQAGTLFSRLVSAV